MDPKIIPTNLDPKLKEMYDRVMALNVPAPQVPQSGPPPLQTPTPIAPTPQPPTPPQPTPTAPKPATTFIATTQKKSSLKLMPVLLIIGGILFFAVYAIFWVKFFNLPVPFLPF